MTKIGSALSSVIILILILLPAGSVMSDKNKLRLSEFDGKWEGEGTYYLSFTNIPTTIDGVGNFKYDSTTNILHTRFSAERFMIQYSDTGRMSYIPNKDSVRWDIWNSFGYYVQYRGGVDGKSIHGQQKLGKYLFDIYIDMITADSIKIHVTATDSDGDSSDRVRGYLRRVQSQSNNKK